MAIAPMSSTPMVESSALSKMPVTSWTDGGNTTAGAQTNFVSLASGASTINTTYSLGNDVMNGLKGSLQFVTGIVDTSLNSSMGVFDIGAIAIMVSLLAIGVGYARKPLAGFGKSIKDF